MLHSVPDRFNPVGGIYPGFLCRDSQALKDRGVDQEKDPETLLSPKKGNLYCAICRYKITQEEYKIAIGEQQEFTFFNPSGRIFHIGCFQEAPGCVTYGMPSNEFSWFPGFSWQIVCCSNCQEHLGWLFLGGMGEHFFALILARLHSDGGPANNGLSKG